MGLVSFEWGQLWVLGTTALSSALKTKLTANINPIERQKPSYSSSRGEEELRKTKSMWAPPYYPFWLVHLLHGLFFFYSSSQSPSNNSLTSQEKQTS